MPRNAKTPATEAAEVPTSNGNGSRAGADVLRRLRCAEKARPGARDDKRTTCDVTAKFLLYLLTRAVDNGTRTLKISQAELAKRVGCDERTVRNKLCLLDDRYIGDLAALLVAPERVAGG
jgi:hypothetical protein